ncbi:MAG: hypothetical protein HEEMFOPI_01347 [Holosporales bacterium]
MIEKFQEINRPFIFLRKIRYKSLQSFLATLFLWFICLLTVDLLAHFVFLNLHAFASFKFSMSSARYLHLEESGIFIFHSLLSSCITGAYVMLMASFERRKLYQVKMIRSFRNEKRRPLEELKRGADF